MLTDELTEYSQNLFQDIVAGSHATEKFSEEYFFEKFCDILIEAGEINDAISIMYKGPPGSGVRVDGYGGNPYEDRSGTLNLIISDLDYSQDNRRLTKTEMDSQFRRLSKFLKKALDSNWRNSLEETSPAFELADLITQYWSEIYKVRLFLLSNRQLSNRVDGRDADKIDGKPVTYSVWDIERIFRFDTVGRGRDEIEIDLESEYGGAIPILFAQESKAEHESYLTIVPGTVLANIYERWGARLLEQNVRVFLQARGNVNKGIRRSIESEPSMFFAYNNGITATAEEVEVCQTNEGAKLKRLKHFQIVNGGQTTASIHLAHRAKVNLEQIFIQMKLSVVQPERTREVIPKISQYANSQNRVSASDFFSNHPFHVRIEKFSRRMFAPAAEGTFRQRKWFYERARGQYAEARSLLTQAERKKFDLENPRSQLFSKTDLAKYINVWREKPDLVSRGAQANFIEFAEYIERSWEKKEKSFNEAWFKDTIVKAIIFKRVEQIVSSQEWYQGGYRANIVAYTIAKLAFHLRTKSLYLNSQLLWKRQSLSQKFENELAIIAKKVHDVLTTPDSGYANVTQWAKKPQCWRNVKETQIDWQSEVNDDFIPIEEHKQLELDARKDWRVISGIEAQISVCEAGAEFWKDAEIWGLKNGYLSQNEAGIVKIATRLPNKMPTEKQSTKLIDIFHKLKQEGFDGTLPQ